MSRLISIALIDPSPWADLFPHDEEHVSRLAEDVAERGVQTPIHVFPIGGRFELLAGHDRLEAAKRAGKTEIPADFRSTLSDEEERFEYFLKDNTLRKDVDKRAVSRHVLLRHPDWSDRRVAALAGCDGKTVASVRAEMVERAEIPHAETRTDTAGRPQPATKPERPRVPDPVDLKKYRERHGIEVTAPKDEPEEPAPPAPSADALQPAEPETPAAPEAPSEETPASAPEEPTPAAEAPAPAREKKARERKPKAAPAPAAEKEDFGDDIATELEHAHKEIERLEGLVTSLSKSDLAQEVKDWAMKFDQLNGRLQQAITTGTEAAKDATRRGRTLADIRKELGVERDSEILPTLRALKARQAA